MATKTYSLNIDVNTSSVRELEQELAQINDQLKDVDRNSQAFDDLAKAAQKVTGELDKANNKIKGFTAEDKIRAADGAIKTFGGSLQTVVGTLGAFGVESEIFGKFEERAASVIAVGMGLKDLSEGLGQVSEAYKKSGIAAKLFGNTAKSALIATGIGAFIVALGTIVAYWDDIKGAVSGVSSETEDLLESQKAGVQAAEDQLAAVSASENILKLQGKSEKEIIQLKMAQTKEVISQLEAQLLTQKEIKRAQVEAAERNRTIAQGIIAFLTAPVTILLGAVDALTYGLQQVGLLEEATNLAEGFTGGIANLIFDPEEVASEGDKAIAETEKKLNQLKNQQAGFQLSINKIDEDAAKDRAAKAEERAKKEEEERQKKLEEEKKYAEDKANLQKEIREAEANTEAEIRAKELEDLALHYDSLIEQAKQFGIDTTELERSKLEALQQLKSEFDQQDLDRQKAIDDQLLKEKEDATNREIQLEHLKSQAKQQFVDALAQLAGTETKIGRALLAFKQAIALQETLQDIKRITFKGTQAVGEAVVDAASNVSSSAKIGFPQNLITIAAAIAQGVTLVGAVKSAVSKTKGGSAAAGGSAPSVASAQRTPVTSLPQGPTGVEAPQSIGIQPTVRAYVVSGDVRSTQEADAKLNTRRTLTTD